MKLPPHSLVSDGDRSEKINIYKYTVNMQEMELLVVVL